MKITKSEENVHLDTLSFGEQVAIAKEIVAWVKAEKSKARILALGVDMDIVGKYLNSKDIQFEKHRNSVVLSTGHRLDLAPRSGGKYGLILIDGNILSGQYTKNSAVKVMKRE
jgi:hypothetical protein